MPKLCISWDKANRGIILMTPKQRLSEVSPLTPSRLTPSFSTCGGTSSPAVFSRCSSSSALSRTPARTQLWKTSQEPHHSCPLGRAQLQHSPLCPQTNGRSGGNKARLITWEQIPLTTSRGNLTLTSNRNAAIFPWTHHFAGTYFLYLVFRAGLRKVCYSC